LSFVFSFFSSAAWTISAACAKSGNAVVSTSPAVDFDCFLPIFTPLAVVANALEVSMGDTEPNCKAPLAFSAVEVEDAPGGPFPKAAFFLCSQALTAGGGPGCLGAGTGGKEGVSFASFAGTLQLGSSSSSFRAILVGAVLVEATSDERFGDAIDAVLSPVLAIDGDEGVTLTVFEPGLDRGV